MNQNIQNWIIEQANNITNWANSEIPSFIQDFLTWNFYSNIIDALFCVFVLACIAWLGIRLREKLKQMFDDCCPLIMLVGLLSLVVTPPLIVIGYASFKEAIMIKVAPKVYLVEKAASLIKNK
jgi:hypothetical protein